MSLVVQCPVKLVSLLPECHIRRQSETRAILPLIRCDVPHVPDLRVSSLQCDLTSDPPRNLFAYSLPRLDAVIVTLVVLGPKAVAVYHRQADGSVRHEERFVSGVEADIVGQEVDGGRR